MKLWPLSKVAYKLGNQPIFSPFFRPIFSARSNQAIIIPVNEVVQRDQSMVLPYTLLPPLVEQASTRFIMSHCMCRRNEHCQVYPHKIGCLFLGDGAAQINPALGQVASLEEARAHFDRAMQAGLVPLIAHTVFDSYLLGIPYRRMLTICFCCDCCCTVRHGLRLGPPAFWEIVTRLPGLRLEAGEACVGCGSCLETCPTKAISLVEGHAVFGALCKGCGRCLETCPVGAINLHLDDQVSPLDSLLAGISQHTEFRMHGKPGPAIPPTAYPPHGMVPF
jgi:UDP-glucose 4-epimerase